MLSKAAAAPTLTAAHFLSHFAACSNRSAALLQLSKVTKALADADECIRLRPDWDKGYYRQAAALEKLERWEEVGAGGSQRAQRAHTRGWRGGQAGGPCNAWEAGVPHCSGTPTWCCV